MSRQWVRRSNRCAGRALAALLVVSVINVSVPAFAEQAASEKASAVSTGVTNPVATMSIADAASRHIRSAFERSVATEARRFAEAGQGDTTVAHSGHWCAGGLALLAGGVAAAVVSGARRPYNAQEPSPPVGVVLGTAAAVVGGIETIRACRR